MHKGYVGYAYWSDHMKLAAEYALSSKAVWGGRGNRRAAHCCMASLCPADMGKKRAYANSANTAQWLLTKLKFPSDRAEGMKKRLFYSAAKARPLGLEEGGEYVKERLKGDFMI